MKIAGKNIAALLDTGCEIRVIPASTVYGLRVRSLEIEFFIIEMAAINNSTGTGTDNHSSHIICNIISYNLHGFNNGRSGLVALCDDPNTMVVVVQEHWLRP